MITIFYFSGTGNTWFAANELYEHLVNLGETVRLFSIEDDELRSERVLQQLAGTSDKIVIGYPIYASRAPKQMEDFIRKFPRGSGRQTISFFTTVALYSGDGPVYYRKDFTAKGWVPESSVEFITSNNFNVPGFPNVLPVGSDDKIRRLQKRVSARALRMAEALINNKAMVQGTGPLAKLAGNTQRKHIDSYIRKINDSFIVDQDRCVGCGLCVNICAAKNISEEDGRIVIGSNCEACMRCYHFCPAKAVNLTEASKDDQKWPRFKGPNREFIKILKELRR